MIDLLKIMIKASKAAILPLHMSGWYCGTACCLCGDVSVYKNPDLDVDYLSRSAMGFSYELDHASEALFGSYCLAGSIYKNFSRSRRENAKLSNVFTKEELQHPHLTTDHSDRAIAIDYIELVIRKCEGKINEK